MSKRFMSWTLVGLCAVGMLTRMPRKAEAVPKRHKLKAQMLTGLAGYQPLDGVTRPGLGTDTGLLSRSITPGAATGSGAAYFWKRRLEARKAKRHAQRLARRQASESSAGSLTSSYASSLSAFARTPSASAGSGLPLSRRLRRHMTP